MLYYYSLLLVMTVVWEALFDLLGLGVGSLEAMLEGLPSDCLFIQEEAA